MDRSSRLFVGFGSAVAFERISFYMFEGCAELVNQNVRLPMVTLKTILYLSPIYYSKGAALISCTLPSNVAVDTLLVKRNNILCSQGHDEVKVC